MDVTASSKGETWRQTLLLSFQSLGVVFGRLSTAPLYVLATLNTEDLKSEDDLYGVLSFVFWTLTLIPLMKHANSDLQPHQGDSNEITQISNIDDEESKTIKTKAQSRARRAIENHKSVHYSVLFLALFGACLVIADGVLTPALSVLSASTDLEKSLTDLTDQVSHSSKTKKSVSDALDKYVPVPIACVVLIGLFALQHFGTHKIGFIFAPVIVLWLLFIASIGLYNILHYHPLIIRAVFPLYMYKFFRNVDVRCWRSLGSVALCIAGSEAMFANLGHFSKKSIKFSFVFFVYPALLLSYAGQVAFISKAGLAKHHITYLGHSVPKPARPLFTVLCLLASAVGSQATITATFSMIKQCQALNCFPRVKIVHTSDKIHGQVYIPDINWLVMVLTLAITIGFRDISMIVSAAGIVIIAGMTVTTCLMSLVFALHWGKNVLISAGFFIFFSSVEALCLSACLLRFHRSECSLIVLIVICLACMLAWHYGTTKKYEFEEQNKVLMDWLVDLSSYLGVARVPGIGFIYTDVTSGIPAFFSHFITNLPAFHQVLIFVSFKPVLVPHVTPGRRYIIGRVGRKDFRMYRCIVRFGYCDPIRDTNDFEDQLIHSIANFISMEGNNSETMSSSEGSITIIGDPTVEQHALIPLEEINMSVVVPSSSSPHEDHRSKPVRRKVKFSLSPEKPIMQESVRDELQELVNARESGTAYFLGQSHLCVREGPNFLKKLLIMTYVFLDKNCREPPVALNIPHAALVEVGMVYTL
ncbi:hypothetical protein Syun_021917 [Stephania yunnanensis]|uniref:Potassium transporter n=1 Tax=Stephania yunnanensis TaxID=152371 RepID=A0AAP0NRJ5_9MAGN